MWTVSDIRIVVDDDLSDDPIVTAEISTPAGRLKLMADVDIVGRRLRLKGLHMHGDGFGPSEFGAGNLRRLTEAVMERLDCDEIIVEGAARTSGANPGRAPALHFRRRGLRS